MDGHAGGIRRHQIALDAKQRIRGNAFRLRIECPNDDVICLGGAGGVNLPSVDQKPAVGLGNGNGAPWVVDFAAGLGDREAQDSVLVQQLPG